MLQSVAIAKYYLKPYLKTNFYFFQKLQNKHLGDCRTALISCMKANKKVLSKNVEGSIVASLEKKIKTLNASALLPIVHIFGLSKSETFSYIERWFTNVSETPSFLELDFDFVRKILSSSELHVTSEIEVFTAADAWMSHRYQERREHAQDLLATVRLSLLSQPALNFVFQKSTSFKKQRCCLSVKEYHLENNAFYGKVSSKLDTNRYCNQYSYKILTFGDVLRYGQTLLAGKIKFVDETKTNNFSFQAFNLDRSRNYKTAVLKGKIYLFSNDPWLDKSISVFTCFFKAEILNKTEVATIEKKRSMYSVCGVIDKVYVIGGIENNQGSNSCIEFDTKSNEHKQVSAMTSTRAAASSCVFKGRIVVTGGCNADLINDMLEVDLRTVEFYDHVADAWSQLPDMVHPRSCHGSVAVRNKIFVVGGMGRDTSEVFDAVSEKFVLLAKTSPVFKCLIACQKKPFLFGNKVVVPGSNKILFIDTETGKWSEVKSRKVCDVFSMYLCVKFPISKY